MPSAERVAVVDESFVRKFFKKGEDPIGTRFGIDEVKNSGTFEIVGVVRTANYSRPQRALAAAFIFRASGAARALRQSDVRR